MLTKMKQAFEGRRKHCSTPFPASVVPLFYALWCWYSVLRWSCKQRFEEKIWICLVCEHLSAVHGNSHLSPGGFETAVMFINGLKIIDERDYLHEEQSSAETLDETYPDLSGVWGKITWKGEDVLFFSLCFHLPLFLLVEDAYKASSCRLLKNNQLVKSINKQYQVK